MLSLLHERLEAMLQRELERRGLVQGTRGFETKLIGWVEAEIPRSGYVNSSLAS
jgi:hypothetical protein